MGCTKHGCVLSSRANKQQHSDLEKHRINKISIINLVADTHQHQQVEVYITDQAGKTIQATQRLKDPTVSRWCDIFTV